VTARAISAYRGLVQRGVRRIAVLASVIIVVLSCGEIREDEMLCEESVSKLIDCCPNLDARRFICVYDPGGCGNPALTPIFSAKASKCVHDRSCDDLKNKGSCQALHDLALVPGKRSDIPAFEAEACK
jgi:hypothetical protein